MFNKLFNEFNKLNIKFNINEDKIVSYKVEEDVKLKVTDNLYSQQVKESKNTKFLIKATVDEANLNYYSNILSNEKDCIKLGLEFITKTIVKCDLVFVADTRTKELCTSLSTEGRVIEVKAKELNNISKVIAKAFNNSKVEEVVVLDILYLFYIGQEVKNEEKHVLLSVYGDFEASNKVVKVQEGITVDNLLKLLNVKENEISKIVCGGVLTGQGVYDLNMVIDSKVRSIIIQNENEVNKSSESACIRCAKCLRACPVGLNPIALKDMWKRKDNEQFLALGGNNCVDCGRCSYVCPSNIELAHSIKSAKKFINKN